MQYAHLDESGTVTPFKRTERFLVVAVVVEDHQSLRAIERQVKKLRRKTQTRLGSELKAVSTMPTLRRKLLQAVASEDIAIVAVILDKQTGYQKPDDPEDWYRTTVARAVRHCVDRWPQLNITLDKRYTKKALRQKLDQSIRKALGIPASTEISIEQCDSRDCLALQVADFAAWSVARKYEADDSDGYELIKSKIVVEEVIPVVETVAHAKEKRASP